MERADAIAGLIAAAEPLLGLNLADDSRKGVAANLHVLFERAAEFADVLLEEALDPASLLRL